MTIEDAFNKSVDYYDAWVRKAVPCYEELFRVAVESVPFSTGKKLSILDLGAGTGLFTWHVFQQYRNSAFTLMDMADQLKWLNGAGFEKIDCLYHHYFVGVFFAQKRILSNDRRGE